MAGKLRVHPDQEHHQPHRSQPRDDQGAGPQAYRRHRRGARQRGHARHGAAGPFPRRGEELPRRSDEAARPAPRRRFPQERMRVGRGIAAGKGKTAGRGTKARRLAPVGRSSRGSRWTDPIHVRVPKLRASQPIPNRVRGRQRRSHQRPGRDGHPRRAELAALPTPPRLRRRPASPAPVTITSDILAAVGLVRSLDKPLKVSATAT